MIYDDDDIAICLFCIKSKGFWEIRGFGNQFWEPFLGANFLQQTFFNKLSSTVAMLRNAFVKKV
jgi:hypothetical protein